MTEKNTHLSVILPVYNSASFIRESLGSLDEYLCGLPFDKELIIVDDGSGDDSLKIVEEWAGTPRSYDVRVIPHDKNRGKGAAVATGMLSANGRYRIFLDADLAYPPSQISKILGELEAGNDVVTANRVHEETRYTISPSFFHYLYTRHLASRLINWFLRTTIIPNCHDSQAGLKGFTAASAKLIFERQRIAGFSFDIEVLYLAEKLGLTIKETGVDYRYFSEPTTVAFLSDGLGIVSDIIRIHANRLRGRYDLRQKKTKKLVINADDFGMTLPISRGILKACAAGTVRSLSVMTNSPDFEGAMNELGAFHARPDVGLHATLTWGRPVLSPKLLPTLVDDEGNFLSREKLLLRSLCGRVDPEEVYMEISAQFDRLSSHCAEINHINGHHHVHVFPRVREAIERLARERGVRTIRAPREWLWSPWRRAFVRRGLMATLPASKPSFWRKRGFISTDNFGGYSLSACEDLRQRWIETLEKIPHGTSEIMVHPGYASDNKDIYNEGREEEIKVLEDPAFARLAKAHGIEFASFTELAQERTI